MWNSLVFIGGIRKIFLAGMGLAKLIRLWVGPEEKEKFSLTISDLMLYDHNIIVKIQKATSNTEYWRSLPDLRFRSPQQNLILNQGRGKSALC